MWDVKKLWTRLERFLERVSRGRRIAFNLFFTVLLLGLLWAREGYPLPTAELEFRRLERASLTPPGELVFASDQKSKDLLNVSSSHRSVYALDGTELHLYDRWFVSLGEDWAAVALVGKEVWDRELNVYPLEPEGPTPGQLRLGLLGHRDPHPRRGLVRLPQFHRPAPGKCPGGGRAGGNHPSDGQRGMYRSRLEPGRGRLAAHPGQ